LAVAAGICILTERRPYCPIAFAQRKGAAAVQALRIRLFGQFRAEWGQHPLETLKAPRVQELLSYLLLHRADSHARDALAGRLWPEEPAGASRKALRQTLWQLRRVLDTGGTAGEPSGLLVEGDRVGWDDAADVWLDTARLEGVSGEVRDAPGNCLNADQVQRLRDAVALYRGDLLQGWYQDWCLFERERLQGLYLGLLDKLMAACEAGRRYEEGIEYGNRILRVDHARERAHWRLMRLHFLLGDRTAALRQYQRCVEALQEELGVAPSVRTEALYQQIRAGRQRQDVERRSLPIVRRRRVVAQRLRRAADAKETVSGRAPDAPPV
jgi:DNA-binding SARP family transcriptional activator